MLILGKRLRKVSLPWALQTSPLIGYHGAKEFLFGTPIGQDEAIYDFMARRFGVRTAELMEPMVLGIFAGNIRKLSMRSCFPEIWDMAQARASITGSAYSLVRGMLGYGTVRTCFAFHLSACNYRFVHPKAL